MHSPLSGAFLKERFEKEEHFFRIYDTYTPDFNKTLLTGKFYSKYEGPTDEDADPQLMEQIRKVKSMTPPERYIWPCTENQRYGWFTELLVPVDVNDERFYHPKLGADFVKHALKLKLEESTLPKDKFAGIPFKVQ